MIAAQFTWWGSTSMCVQVYYLYMFNIVHFDIWFQLCMTMMTSVERLAPNTIKSYKILQKLSPKHAAHGVAQSTYPIYRHGKACLSKQPPWRAAGDPRLAHGRSRVRAPGPAGRAARAFFLHPPFLPPSGDVFFSHLPHQPRKSVRVNPV